VTFVNDYQVEIRQALMSADAVPTCKHNRAAHVFLIQTITVDGRPNIRVQAVKRIPVLSQDFPYMTQNKDAGFRAFGHRSVSKFGGYN